MSGNDGEEGRRESCCYEKSTLTTHSNLGKFAGKYIKSEFFMDVHPPLGKLLITAAGVLSGYNGTFDFKEIGLDYVANSVPYIGMRSLTAALGVALIPVCNSKRLWDVVG